MGIFEFGAYVRRIKILGTGSIIVAPFFQPKQWGCTIQRLNLKHRLLVHHFFPFSVLDYIISVSHGQTMNCPVKVIGCLVVYNRGQLFVRVINHCRPLNVFVMFHEQHISFDHWLSLAVFHLLFYLLLHIWLPLRHPFGRTEGLNFISQRSEPIDREYGLLILIVLLKIRSRRFTITILPGKFGESPGGKRCFILLLEHFLLAVLIHLAVES